MHGFGVEDGPRCCASSTVGMPPRRSPTTPPTGWMKVLSGRMSTWILQGGNGRPGKKPAE